MKLMTWTAHVLLVAAATLGLVTLLAEAAYNRVTGTDAAALASPVPTMVGYGLDYRRGPLQARSDCVIYRFVSRRCVACRWEEPSWERALGNPGRAHCQAVIVLPNLQSAPYLTGRTSIPQILWLRLDWARSVKLTVTPTTIVAERQRLVWKWEGALGPRGLSQLQAIIAAVGEK